MSRCCSCKDDLSNYEAAVESLQGDLYCSDCGADVEMECPVCNGSGSICSYVVRSWHDSPPEKICGRCGGEGMLTYAESRDRRSIADEIEDMKAGAKISEMEDEGSFPW